MMKFVLLAALPLASAFAPHTARVMRATVRNSEVASAEVAEREPKLFVSNLSFKTTDSDLESMFAEHGVVVEAHHVNDKFDPERRRGFGFVTMDSFEAAKAAVEALNGLETNGRSMNVDFALSKEESKNRPAREPRTDRPARAPRADTTGRRVYVGNLGYATTDDTLNEVFSEFGEIEHCQHLTEREEPFRRRGFGFVTFGTKESADAACEALDGLEVDGRNIKVNIAQPKTF